MSLQNPSATRLRWSSSLLEILAEPHGNAEPNNNAERQRAAAFLMRLLLHPDVQDKLEAVVLLHTEWRTVRALGRALSERGLVPSDQVASHLCLHSSHPAHDRPRTRRALRNLPMPSQKAAILMAGLTPETAYEAGEDPRRVMARVQTAEDPAALCARLLADAKEDDEMLYFELMSERLRLDIGEYDALDLSMVEEVFVFGATYSFQATEAFTAWALHKPSLFEGAFLSRAYHGHALSDSDVERAHTSKHLVVRISALGIDARHSKDAALRLERLCAEADDVVERAEALRVLRKTHPARAAHVGLAQLHDVDTYSYYLAPMREECAASITPEHCGEDAFDKLVEARLAARERRFDDDSHDGAGGLESTIGHWLGEKDRYFDRKRMRIWTIMFASSALRPDEWASNQSLLDGSPHAD